MKHDVLKHAVSGGPPKSVPTSDAPDAADPDAAAVGAGYFTMRSSFLLLRESLIQISASYNTWFVCGFGTLCRENLVT